MSDDRSQDRAAGADALAELLRAAGRRPEPPAAAYEETLDVAISAWQHKLARRRRRYGIAWAGMAAALVAAIALLIGPDTVPLTEAGTARVVGLVQWQAPDDDAWHDVTAATPASIVAGSRVRTGGDGYAAFAHRTGASVRLAPRTTLRFDGDGEIALMAGTVYVDSGAGAVSESLTIVTPAGRAVEIGTQFEVTFRDDRYRLRVREGRVRLERDDGSIENAAGEELRIAADGRIDRGTVAPSADDWRWTLTVAPAPVIDSKPVTVLLEWVSRETGRALRYASPDIRERALNTILHGRLGDLEPMEALDAMLATTDLDYAIATDGTIEIRARAQQ